MTRKPIIAAVVAVALTLTACTTTTVEPTGVVTGLTAECTAASPPVKVSLYSGPTLVASTTVRAGTSYRLSAAAGSYQVRGLGGWSLETVNVRAGRTSTVNSPILGCV